MRIVYFVTTGALTALMLFSAGMYIFNHAEVARTFAQLGHPTHVIYPLAALKVLGLLAIWTRKWQRVTEWAYAGFFFNCCLAMGAHLAVGDGKFAGALLALVLLVGSYVSAEKMHAHRAAG